MARVISPTPPDGSLKLMWFPVSCRIYAEEGAGAFYKGLLVASLRMLPVGGISRATYELMQASIRCADDQLEEMRGAAELHKLVKR